VHNIGLLSFFSFLDSSPFLTSTSFRFAFCRFAAPYSTYVRITAGVLGFELKSLIISSYLGEWGFD
jgi:hypothetical protein